MLALILKIILVLLSFQISLAFPYGIYFPLVLLIGLNLFVGREVSYKMAFTLGLLFDLAHVQLLFLSSTLSLLLLVKLVEFFVERIYNTASELKTYLIIVLLFTSLVNIPALVLNFNLLAGWFIMRYLLFNLISSLILITLFTKFKNLYYLKLK